MAILYEENVFCYELYFLVAPSGRDTSRGDTLHDETFKRIKHLEIECSVGEPGIVFEVHEVELIAQSITDLGFSLRTLRLVFKFYEHDYLFPWEGEVVLGQVRKVARNTALSRNIANSDVREKLEIAISGLYQGTDMGFAEMAINLAYLKQWAIDQEVTSDVGAGVGNLRNRGYRNLWMRTLRPATTSNEINVPKSLFSGVSSSSLAFSATDSGSA